MATSNQASEENSKCCGHCEHLAKYKKATVCHHHSSARGFQAHTKTRLPKARQDKAAERETFLDYPSAVGALASSLHRYPCSGPSAEGTCTEFFSKPMITACHCKDTYLVESRPGLFSSPSPPSPRARN